MSTCGARLQTRTRGFKGRLVRGDAAGGKNSCSLHTLQGAREEKRKGPGRSEAHVHRRRKAHLNAKCDEEEWVELLNEFKKSEK